MKLSASKRVTSIGLLLMTGTLLASACGSEDAKRTSPGPKNNGAGEDAGGRGSMAKGDGGGGAQPEAGNGTTGGTDSTGAVGGALNGNGGSGDSVAGGAGGAGVAGTGATEGCPEGFDNCDEDPNTCETPVTSLAQCGSCDVSCSDEHGDVACSDGKCLMTACDNGYGDCDEDGTTGCELALAENDAHCGDCLRDCAAAGSTCNTRMCAPIVIDASASGFDSYLAGNAMYMMSSGAMPVSSYTLSRIPIDGSARKVVWAASANVANGALWADSTSVYWAVSGTPPSVLMKPASAAPEDLPTVVFQPASQPTFLRGQGANFYWAANGTGHIYARSKTAAMNVAGAAIMNVAQGTFSAFETTPTTLYWIASLNGPELRMVSIAGGAPTAVPDAVVSVGAPTFVAGEKLYFVRSGQANALNGIYSYTAGDTTVKQLVASNSVVAVIADERGIYYKVSGDYHVYKAKLTGSAGVAIANSVYGGVFTGQDDKFIYQVYPWGSGGPAQAIVK